MPRRLPRLARPAGRAFRMATLGALLVAPAVAHPAEEIRCRVVGVSDGDTFVCLRDANYPLKVKLADIDAPERGQPFGAEAKALLADLLLGQDVVLTAGEQDRSGRTPATVRAGAVAVNARMVSSGGAWVVTDHLGDRRLLALEANARYQRAGLWALPDAQRVPPWIWRRDNRQADAAVPRRQSVFSQFGTTPSTSPYHCKRLKACSEMTHCAEATFQLRACGNTRIDVDGDGIPCETICP